MRIIWICNMPPQAVNASLGRKNVEGNWLDHALSNLMQTEDTELQILYRASDEEHGQVSNSVGFASFSEKQPDVYYPELELFFTERFRTFLPDAVHIWGTEYGHTLAAVNAAENCEIGDHVCISIQGLCSVYAEDYTRGVPEKIAKMYTLRDFIQHDNLVGQKAFFARRGALEIKALQKVKHVIGRTPWDYNWTESYNPSRQYHFCNEILRTAFYEGAWDYKQCKKHSIFAPSCAYPIKGFHYLLQAFADVVSEFPDAELYVTGRGFFPRTMKEMLRMQTYQVYLRRLTIRLGLKNKVHFLGKLSAEGMKQAMLSTNVFVLPSVIENSPNSMGEAMLLGVPCVAADVGGVSTLLHAPHEGIVCPRGDVKAFADGICRIFEMKQEASALGRNASSHARQTHNPDTNTKALIDIYSKIACKQEG